MQPGHSAKSQSMFDAIPDRKTSQKNHRFLQIKIVLNELLEFFTSDTTGSDNR
jgi:hypothetical protein